MEMMNTAKLQLYDAFKAEQMISLHTDIRYPSQCNRADAQKPAGRNLLGSRTNKLQ